MKKQGTSIIQKETVKTKESKQKCKKGRRKKKDAEAIQMKIYKLK